MEIEFSILNEQRAVAIEVAGCVSVEDVRGLRRRTVEINRGRGVLSYVESVDDQGVWTIPADGSITVSGGFVLNIQQP